MISIQRNDTFEQTSGSAVGHR